MSTPAPFHVVVIGGGIGGFAAAIGIRRKGNKVTVLERTPDLQTFGGSLLIPPNAGKVLDNYNLLSKFEEANNRTDSHRIIRHDGRLLDIVDHLGIQRMYGYTYVRIQEFLDSIELTSSTIVCIVYLGRCSREFFMKRP